MDVSLFARLGVVRSSDRLATGGRRLPAAGRGSAEKCPRGDTRGSASDSVRGVVRLVGGVVSVEDLFQGEQLTIDQQDRQEHDQRRPAREGRGREGQDRDQAYEVAQQERRNHGSTSAST